MNSYDIAEKAVDKILRNMSPERCTWGEKYWEAYKDLHNFRADMIQDVKGVIEAEMKANA